MLWRATLWILQYMFIEVSQKARCTPQENNRLIYESQCGCNKSLLSILISLKPWIPFFSTKLIAFLGDSKAGGYGIRLCMCSPLYAKSLTQLWFSPWTRAINPWWSDHLLLEIIEFWLCNSFGFPYTFKLCQELCVSCFNFQLRTKLHFAKSNRSFKNFADHPQHLFLAFHLQMTNGQEFSLSHTHHNYCHHENQNKPRLVPFPQELKIHQEALTGCPRV